MYPLSRVPNILWTLIQDTFFEKIQNKITTDESWTATADIWRDSTSFSSILLIPSFYTIELVFFLNVRWGGWVAGLIKINASLSKAELAAGRW